MQSALVDGVEILAWELTNRDFELVKQRYRTDRECLKFRDGLQAIPRGGPQRRNHFSHRPGEGTNYQPETAHHIRAKSAIYNAARSRGWLATIEARHPKGHWQADVLVEKLGRRIAFEVQWSAQSLSQFQDRTERYRRDGIETVWIVRSTARAIDSLARDLDVIPFDESGAGRPIRYPLEPTFCACLDLFQRDERRSSSGQIYRHRCYKCAHVWFSTELGSVWGEKRAFTNAEGQVLGRWAGLLQVDYSHTLEQSYPMWHCPHCRAKQGDFYLRPVLAETVHGGTVIPDLRGKPLWDALEGQLKSAGIDPIDRPTDGSRPEPPTDQIRHHRAIKKQASHSAIRSCDTAQPDAGQDARRAEPASPIDQESVQARSVHQSESDAIRREAEADKRPSNDPAKIKALYARTLRAARLINPQI